MKDIGSRKSAGLFSQSSNLAMCLLFHLCLLFPTAAAATSPDALGHRQLKNIFDQGASAVSTSKDATSTKEHSFIDHFLAKEEDPAVLMPSTALLFQQRQSGADGTSEADTNQNATDTVSLTDTDTTLIGNVTSGPTGPPNTTTMAPLPSYVLAINSSFVISVPTTTGANGTMPALGANATMGNMENSMVLNEGVAENLTKAYAALSLSVVFNVNGQIFEASMLNGNSTTEDNGNTNDTDANELTRVRERRFLRAALPLPVPLQHVGNRRLAEASDLNATVNYVSNSATLLGSFPRLSCPEGTANADGSSCLTVFAQYEVTVQDSEDSQSVYNALVAETQAAIDDGELQQSLGQIDPDSSLLVEGSSEPVSLPALEATVAPSEPIETVTPTTVAPTTIAPATGSSAENNENEDDDNDDGGVDGVMLGLIIAISVTAVIIGVLAAVFCYLRRKTPTAENEDKGLDNVEGAAVGEEDNGANEKDPEAQQDEDPQPMEHHPGDDPDPDDDDNSDWPSSHGDLFSEEEQNELNESNTSDVADEVNEREKIEKLVSEKCPEEQENIEDLLDQFKGRESSLIATLENMEEVDREILEKDESENQDGELSVHDESLAQRVAPLAMEDSEHEVMDEVNSVPAKDDDDNEDPAAEASNDEEPILVAVLDTDGDSENEAGSNPTNAEEEEEEKAISDESKALGAGAVLLAAAVAGQDRSESEEESEEADICAGGDDNDDPMESQPETEGVAVEADDQKEENVTELAVGSDDDVGDDESNSSEDDSNPDPPEEVTVIPLSAAGTQDEPGGGDDNDDPMESQPETEGVAVESDDQKEDPLTESAGDLGDDDDDDDDDDNGSNSTEDGNPDPPEGAEDNSESQGDGEPDDSAEVDADTMEHQPETQDTASADSIDEEESNAMDTSTDAQKSDDRAPNIEGTGAIDSTDQSEEATVGEDSQKENGDKNEVQASTEEEKDAVDSEADIYAGAASIDGGESKDPRDLDSSDDFDWGDEESIEGDEVAQRGRHDDDTAESGGDIYARSDSIDEGDSGALGGDKEPRDLESSDDDIDWDEEGSGDDSGNSDENGAEKWEEGDNDDEDWEDGEDAENIDESADDNVDESEDWSE